MANVSSCLFISTPRSPTSDFYPIQNVHFSNNKKLTLMVNIFQGNREQNDEGKEEGALYSRGCHSKQKLSSTWDQKYLKIPIHAPEIYWKPCKTRIRRKCMKFSRRSRLHHPSSYFMPRRRLQTLLQNVRHIDIFLRFKIIGFVAIVTNKFLPPDDNTSPIFLHYGSISALSLSLSLPLTLPPLSLLFECVFLKN